MMELVNEVYIDGCIPVECVGDLNMATPRCLLNLVVVAGVAYQLLALISGD